MAEAISRGCTLYDLYGVDSSGRPDHAYHRLSQFKRRFGGDDRVYAGAHDLYDYNRVAEAMIPFLQLLAVEEAPAAVILHENEQKIFAKHVKNFQTIPANSIDMHRVWPDGWAVVPDPTDPSRGTLVKAY